VSGPGRGGDGVAALLAARSVTLYALSLHAAGSALLAWTPAAAGVLAATAFGLALALVLGETIGRSVDAGLAGAGRIRLRVMTGTAYGGLVALALTAGIGSGEARLLGTEAMLFSVLQAAFLLLVELGRTHVGPVANAFVLVVLASLRGGVPAAAGVTGALALLAFFLAFDHAARVLQAYPSGRADLLPATIRRAARTAGPIVLGLTVFFALFPPPPYTRVHFAVGTGPVDDDVSEAYRRLVAIALVGSGLVFGAVRLIRRGRGDSPLLEEGLPLERGIEEALPEEAAAPPREYPGRRGRIVRAYVAVLARARETGFRQRPSQTPHEIASHLPAPAGPLTALTALFVGARYGPDEPSEEQALAAEGAGAGLVAGLRGRRRR